MAENKYWFARYTLKPRPSRGLMPIAWEGWAVIFGFIVALVVGGIALLLLGLLAQQLVLGLAVFAIFAVAGGGAFLWSMAAKSDPTLTALDYLTAGR